MSFPGTAITVWPTGAGPGERPPPGRGDRSHHRGGATVRRAPRLTETQRAHGPRPWTRAAEFARLRSRLLDLPDHTFQLLHRACAGHTHERTHPDVTIQTCWDADRLDLGRVGITPDPGWLCTTAARRPDMIRWADGRASFGVIPELVKQEWWDRAKV